MFVYLHVKAPNRCRFYMIHTKAPQTYESGGLTLLPATLADLGGETGLDGRDTTSGTAFVAGDEVETVFSLVEFCVWGSAGLAGDIFHY